VGEGLVALAQLHRAGGLLIRFAFGRGGLSFHGEIWTISDANAALLSYSDRWTHLGWGSTGV